MIVSRRDMDLEAGEAQSEVEMKLELRQMRGGRDKPFVELNGYFKL
jgi:hypothetical protein